jgi:hypothetical protein
VLLLVHHETKATVSKGKEIERGVSKSSEEQAKKGQHCPSLSLHPLNNGKTHTIVPLSLFPSLPPSLPPCLPALARLAVLNHSREDDAPIRLKGIAEGRRLGAEGEVAHEELETLCVLGGERRGGRERGTDGLEGEMRKGLEGGDRSFACVCLCRVLDG